MIDHTYGIAEESGTWYITVDGEISRNITYVTSKSAQRIADKLTTASNLWTGVFAIETKIAQALKNEPWPYGATCVNHGTDTDQEWILTEPYRSDEVVRLVNPDPTGYVQISVYTRPLYEIACLVADIDPDTDESISAEFCDYGHGQLVPEDANPPEVVKSRLNHRRSIGIHIEKTIEYDARLDLLESAKLMINCYTRLQYASACSIMGTALLEDEQVMLIVLLDVIKGMGMELDIPNVPNDLVTTNLAYSRAAGIITEKHDDK